MSVFTMINWQLLTYNGMLGPRKTPLPFAYICYMIVILICKLIHNCDNSALEMLVSFQTDVIACTLLHIIRHCQSRHLNQTYYQLAASNRLFGYLLEVIVILLGLLFAVLAMLFLYGT